MWVDVVDGTLDDERERTCQFPSLPSPSPPSHLLTSPHPTPHTTTHPPLLFCGVGAAKSSLRSTVYPHMPSRESVTSTQPGVRHGVPHDHESDDAPRKMHESLQVGRGRGADSRRIEAALVSARQWLEHREARCPFSFSPGFLSIRACMNMCDEAGVIMELRGVQEEELRQCFERSKRVNALVSTDV